MRKLLVVAALALAGCAAPVSPEAQMVRQVAPGGPGCKFLGVVRVEGGLIYSSKAEAQRDMMNQLRNSVAARGGNGYVAREVVVERGFSLPSGEAEAYACP